ncbi:MAG: 16S rRNA (guanine(966)-N(2))-methyltransferase RsmD [Microbacteriaceae bacterium]|nr:16S rRNA (guanine(966)-N(2))-methyltransferase RsmD [Microbacteriaceae bacterium]
MTRIIAGFAGSLALAVPRAGTRPTSDRVREAVFSALDAADVLGGARVLDLYAGSGALGLEAASRGAAAVVLVERDAAAAAVCRRNAAVIRASSPRGAAPSIDVAAQSVASWLAGAGAGAAPWDLVFIDPPYDVPEGDVAGVLAALEPLLSEDATVIVERSARSPEPTLPPGLALRRTKSYGETAVHWLARA